MPPLIDDIWPPKPQAIMNLEQSLRDNRPRSLVQMATGSGKTLLAIVLSYRLIKFAGAKRILFLVDRGNLGKQTLKEFQQYVSPYNNYKFHEEYIVQRLTSNTLDTSARRFASARSSASIRCSGDRSLMRKPTSARSRVWNRSSKKLRRSNTTRHSRSRLSTSSSPTSATARSTISGVRCWNTSTPI